MTIGIKLSTTFKPVSKGKLTGVREIIEGAITSTNLLVLAIMVLYHLLDFLKDHNTT